MKILFASLVLLASGIFAIAQNEQAPIYLKEVEFKNWNYTDSRTGKAVNLRDYTKGKKLVAVVYYAPWCPNWRHDAPMVEKLYEKYKDKGFAVIGVSEYDTVDAAKANLDAMKITFPSVSESTDRSAKQKTLHDDYRKVTGDTRGWGSPWYIFLMPSTMEKKGDVLTKKTYVINGEMIEAASMRAAGALRPAAANSAGTEFAVAVVWDAATIAMRGGAIRPFSVICADMPSTITTTNERRLPRPSSTSAREPQPLDSTMP